MKNFVNYNCGSTTKNSVDHNFNSIIISILWITIQDRTAALSNSHYKMFRQTIFNHKHNFPHVFIFVTLFSFMNPYRYFFLLDLYSNSNYRTKWIFMFHFILYDSWKTFIQYFIIKTYLSWVVQKFFRKLMRA